MKKLILGLVTTSLIAVSGANADVLDGQDDTYFGLQITIPLDTRSAGPLAKSNRYSVMLLEQSQGIREGLAFTLHGSGRQELSYIRPSVDFEIGRGQLAENSIPLFIRTSDFGNEPMQGFSPQFQLILTNPILFLAAFGFVFEQAMGSAIESTDNLIDNADDIAETIDEINQATNELDQLNNDIDQAVNELDQALDEIEMTITDQLNTGG